MIISIRKSPNNSKIAAMSNVEIVPGVVIKGFKIFCSDSDQKITIYPPSIKKNGKYVNLITLSEDKKTEIYNEIIKEYDKFKNK